MNPASRRRVAQFIARQLADGESVSRVTKVLAAYLVDNKQRREANLILRDIEVELAREHGHLTVDVTSARNLGAETRKALLEMLKSESNVKNIELIESVDPGLIGGVIVRTPESELDASLKTKLTKLRAI